MSLKDFRAQHPEYNDVPDQELANALYAKFYSDVPREEFDRRMGVASDPTVISADKAIRSAKPRASIMNEQTGVALDVSDPRSVGYGALDEAGLIDRSAPKGTAKNPFVQFDGERPEPGQYYIDEKTGRLVQANNVLQDVAMSYPTGVYEGFQSIADPASPRDMLETVFHLLNGRDAPAPKDEGFSAADIFQSVANASTGLGMRLAGDKEGGDAMIRAARANNPADRAAALGADYQPQTGAGKVARFAGQMTPGAAAPGSAPARLANVVLPALGSYTGSEVGGALGGERGEQVGALVGGVVGGMGAGVRPSPARPRVPNTAAARLQAEGVPITPGQKAGGILGALEDKATSIPLVGDVVRAAKGRSVEGFNRAAVNRSLAPIGEELPKDVKTGNDAVAYAGDRLSQGYDDVLSRVAVQADAQLASDIAAIQQAGTSLPDTAQAQLARVIDQVVNRQLQGQVSGQTIKAIESEIGKLAADYGGSAVASERQLGQLLGDVRGAIRDQVARASPNEAAALAQLDEGWANLAIVERAAAQGKDGIFTPGQAKTAMRQGDRSVRKRATARGEARMQGLIDDAQGVLPSSIPDSGTAGRLMAGAGALGLAKVNPLVGVPVTGALGLYSEPGIRAFNAMSRAQLPALTFNGNYVTPLVGGTTQLQLQQQRAR